VFNSNHYSLSLLVMQRVKVHCLTAGFVCMVCKTKPTLRRFLNALKINTLSFHLFIYLFRDIDTVGSTKLKHELLPRLTRLGQQALIVDFKFFIYIFSLFAKKIELIMMDGLRDKK